MTAILSFLYKDQDISSYHSEIEPFVECWLGDWSLIQSYSFSHLLRHTLWNCDPLDLQHHILSTAEVFFFKCLNTFSFVSHIFHTICQNSHHSHHRRPLWTYLTFYIKNLNFRRASRFLKALLFGLFSSFNEHKQYTHHDQQQNNWDIYEASVTSVCWRSLPLTLICSKKCNSN